MTYNKAAQTGICAAFKMLNPDSTEFYIALSKALWLDDTLRQHRVGDFDKAGNISAFDIVHTTIFHTVIHARSMKVLHDAV